MAARAGAHGRTLDRFGRCERGKDSGKPAGQHRLAGAGRARQQKSYKVKNGDTLYRIAIHHGVTVAEILAINSLGGTPSIKAGDHLAIPSAGK